MKLAKWLAALLAALLLIGWAGAEERESVRVAVIDTGISTDAIEADRILPGYNYLLGSDQTGDATQSSRKRTVGLFLCTLCIFFGSCAENAMSSWISGYIENALGVTKAVGDILGVAMFAILLGMARIGYARFGKNISRVLLIGMLGAVACYLVAGLSNGVIPAFIACVATGFFTSMLWPGTLILMEEKIDGAGVAAFALMASGGDLGASVAPQLMGIVIDKVAVSEFALSISEKTGLSPEQIGLKSGMLITSLFPLIGFFIVLIIIRFFKKKDRVR